MRKILLTLIIFHMVPSFAQLAEDPQLGYNTFEAKIGHSNGTYTGSLTENGQLKSMKVAVKGDQLSIEKGEQGVQTFTLDHGVMRDNNGNAIANCFHNVCRAEFRLPVEVDDGNETTELTIEFHEAQILFVVTEIQKNANSGNLRTRMTNAILNKQ